MTKAETLLEIQANIPDINILPIYITKKSEYYGGKTDVCVKIIDFFSKQNADSLVVRSSSSQEDTSSQSNAGKFESILNVELEEKALRDAIETVFESYQTESDEQVLIQPMLKNIAISGVVFTADKDSLSDYYIINYCEGTDTTAVTAGEVSGLKTYVCYKGVSRDDVPPVFRPVLVAASKLEAFFKNSYLDIEFGITRENKLYIFQTRPITVKLKEKPASENLEEALNRIYKKIEKLSRRHPFLLGETTCFGVMPDWNPAEMIGIKPQKLAFSLYKELITDHIWARQRSDYGYRDLSFHPLMVSFCGIPYIDTRITFNSFVPSKLHEKLAEKLVNYYIQKLSQYPKYHDKIEMEIVFSCYYFGIHEKLQPLLKEGFNENELSRIEFALLDLTNHVIHPKDGLYRNELKKIEILEEKYESIMNSDISIIDKIYWLIEDCKKYGTLPFAGIARSAFIAVQMLRSMVEDNILTKDEYTAFMESINTVSKQMSRDLQKVRRNELSKEEFLKTYGHVRPGTYDILSKRYDEAFSLYFKLDEDGQPSSSNGSGNEYKSFNFSQEKLEKIQECLDENGLNLSPEELITFIREAIEGRERVKFIFTKTVSQILKLIEQLGERIEIPVEEMAFLDVSVIKQLYSDLYNGKIKPLFLQNIANNKEQFQKSSKIMLPSIIVNPEDVYSFFLLEEEPNFVTEKQVTAEVCYCENGDFSKNVKGKIVFIQAADPGYDFLFTKGIAGLVTQYGGINSHMTIRCAELGIPAAIGVGEQKFREWKEWNVIQMDCQKKMMIQI